MNTVRIMEVTEKIIEGLPVFDLIGVWYCDNCGERIENTQEWIKEHKRVCLAN